MNEINIGGVKIGKSYPVFVIAEAGVNHNGNLDLAKKLIREAKLSGADAIKFQTYRAQNLVTKTAPIYWHVGANEGESQFEVFSKLDNFPVGFYKDCMKYAKEIGIILISTPFELSAVDLLEEIGVPAYKVASADITFSQLLIRIAQTKKPIILSTGASTIGEIEEAVNLIKSTGNNQIILLHCTLTYPTPQKDANLSMIPILTQLFPDYPIGHSDHTFDPMTPAFATIMGAKVIEKHFTVDKNLDEKNPDNKLGVDPYQLKVMVEEIRQAELSLGGGLVRPETELEAMKLARRSVVSSMRIRKGSTITKQMLICKRPGTGIAPKFLDLIIGRISRKDIPEDTLVSWDMI